MIWRYNVILAGLNICIFRVSKEALKCLDFMKSCKKIFSLTNLFNIYTTYKRQKIEYNSPNWVGALNSILEIRHRVKSGQKSSSVMVGYSTLYALEHWQNVGCGTPFYRYYNGVCFDKIKKLVPRAWIFFANNSFFIWSSLLCDWLASESLYTLQGKLVFKPHHSLVE